MNELGHRSNIWNYIWKIIHRSRNKAMVLTLCPSRLSGARFWLRKSYICRILKMPKKKTGQRKKHDKMKARQKEIGLRGERKDHLNIAERYHCTMYCSHWGRKGEMWEREIVVQHVLHIDRWHMVILPWPSQTGDHLLIPTQALQLHNGVRQVREEAEEPSLLLLLWECEFCSSAYFTWKILRFRDCQCAPSVGNKSAWLRATAWLNIQVTLKMWVKPSECFSGVHSSGLQVPMQLEWPWWEPFVIFVRLGSVTGAHHANFRIYLSWIQPKVPVSTCVLVRTAWGRLHRMRKRCLGPWWQDLHL